MNDVTAPIEVVEPETIHRSLWGDVWRQFRRHKGALAGLFVFVLIALSVTIGPKLHGIDPNTINFRDRNLSRAC